MPFAGDYRQYVEHKPVALKARPLTSNNGNVKKPKKRTRTQLIARRLYSRINLFTQISLFYSFYLYAYSES